MKVYHWILKNAATLAISGLMSSFALAQGVKVKPSSGNSTYGYLGQTPLSQSEVDKSFDSDESSYTELTSSVSALVAISPYLHLNYQNDVPADRPFYAKIQMNDSQLLDKVVGGVVGNALNTLIAGLVGGVPNTEFYFYNSTNQEVYKANTQDFNTVDVNKFRFVLDSEGNYYARFLPGQAFRKFTTRLYTAGLVVTGKWTRFYDTFYYNGNGNCPKTFTYVNASSDLLTAVGNSEPVSNIKNAIDGDLTTYSTFGNQGLIKLGIGKTIEQVVELPTATNTKKVQIKMQMPSGLLNVGVGSGVKVVFYKGNNSLKEVDVDRSILNIDLLGLINSGTNVPFTVTLDPPVDAVTHQVLEYDRIGIKLTQPINLGVVSISGDLRLYDISFVDLNPTPTYVCAKMFNISGGGFEKKFDVTSIIPGFSTADFAKYTITNSSNTEIKFNNIADIANKKWQPLGQYLVRGIDATGYCSDEYYTFLVQENHNNKISGQANVMIPVGATLDFSTLNFTSNIGTAVPQVFDESNNVNVTSSSKLFDQIGTYNYYVKATSADGDCEVIKLLKVYVYENQSCDYRYVKRMASAEDVNTVSLLGIPLGGSYGSSRAVDSDLSTYSQIFNVVSLLGVGTTWQDLKFSSTIPKGTPVTIKLGQSFGVAQVVGGITVRPINAAGQAVGYLKDIGETDLLNALVGDNIFEFTFVPTDNSGNPIDYSGVRVHLGSLLGVGNKMDIYGAYIEERLPIANTVCQPNIMVNGASLPTNTAVNPPDGKVYLNSTTKDVTWGVKDTGLVNAATNLSSVLYPYLAADHHYEYVDNGVTKTVKGLDSYAIFNTAVSVLNTQVLSVKLKEIARPGDQLRIIMGSQNIGVLNLNLLGGFKIQRYMGDVPVGDAIDNSQFSLVNINLFGLLGSTANKSAIVINSTNMPYDRVDIIYTNVVSVQVLGEYTYIYDVSIIPGIDLQMTGQGAEMCTDKVFDVPISDICSTYEFSLAFMKLAADSTPSNPVYEWVDIPDSVLNMVFSNNEIYRYRIPYHATVRSIYAAHLNEAFQANNGNLYLKINTTRQMCQYGEPQYVKVGYIGKCFGTGTNPFIRQNFKTY